MNVSGGILSPKMKKALTIVGTLGVGALIIGGSAYTLIKQPNAIVVDKVTLKKIIEENDKNDMPPPLAKDVTVDGNYILV